MAPVLDFSPLAQLPLEKCYLQHNRITDLAVLRGKPLKELVLLGLRKSAQLRGARGDRDARTPPAPLRVSQPAGRRITRPSAHCAIIPSCASSGAEIMNQMRYDAAPDRRTIFWQEWDREQTFVPALRKSGIKFALHKHLGRRDLSSRSFDQPLRDLSILQGAPISQLTSRLPGLGPDADPRAETRSSRHCPAIWSPISARCVECHSRR